MLAIDDRAHNEDLSIVPLNVGCKNDTINIEQRDVHAAQLDRTVVTTNPSSMLQLVPISKLDFMPAESDFSSYTLVNVRSVSSESSESIDPFANLPENWTHLDFHRRKSCLLTTIHSPCVTKAISHLESLQNAIDKWMEKVERALPESVSSADSSKRLMWFTRRHAPPPASRLRFVDAIRMSRDGVVETSEASGSGPLLPDSQLHNPQPYQHQHQHQLQQQHSNQQNESHTELVVKRNPYPIDDLRAGGILEEILMLLARLESDRQRCELLLHSEQANMSELKSRVERLALQRAVELPASVQREHDACITDITELNWHISFNLKVERKLARKCELGTLLHEQLSDEIANIRKNLPLIDEKIQFELEIYRKIEAAQRDVDELLRKAKDRLVETQDKHQHSQVRAAKDREAIAAELAAAKRELNKAVKRLQEADEVYRQSLKSLDEFSRQLLENVKLENAELHKKTQLRNKLDKLIADSKELKTQRYAVSKEIRSIVDENSQKRALVDAAASGYKAEIDQLTEVLNKKLEKLEKILSKVQEKEIDLEEMARDKTSLLSKIEKDERNRVRLLDEKEKTEEELRNITLSYANTHKLIKGTTQDQEKETRRLEQREDLLKKQIIDLKRQLNEERHITSTMVARISAEAEEYRRSQVTHEQRKKQFEIKKRELDQHMVTFQKRVDASETDMRRLDADVATLSEQLRAVQEEHVRTETELTARIGVLEPACARAVEQRDTARARLEHMTAHTAEMNAKMAEMASAKILMLKAIEKTNAEIEILSQTKKEEQLQCEAAGNLDAANRESLRDATKRLEEKETTNASNLATRGAFCTRLCAQLDKALLLNCELASRYRYLKYDMYNVKLDLLSQLEVKLNTFVNVKDKRQLKSLQERMHAALRDYFNYKIQCSESDLEGLKVETSQVNERIGSLEDLLNSSVHYVTHFLHNKTDFNQVRQQAMQKVRKQELIEEQQLAASAAAVVRIHAKRGDRINLTGTQTKSSSIIPTS